MKYQERYIYAMDVAGNIYHKDVKMTERFTTVDKTFRAYLESLGKKIKRVEWYGDRHFYFDYENV